MLKQFDDFDLDIQKMLVSRNKAETNAMSLLTVCFTQVTCPGPPTQTTQGCPSAGGACGDSIILLCIPDRSSIDFACR